MSLRRTKIVATLGPASSTAEQLEPLIKSGIDVARLNFSHGSAAEHSARAALVRQLAAKHGRCVAILADLQGPKIRIAKFAAGKVMLHAGQRFSLSARHDKSAGTAELVGIDYPELVDDCRAGDILLLDDGRISLKVLSVADQAVHTEVLNSGALSDRKGINRQGGGLTAPALTDKDRADIRVAAEINADFVAVSFPRDAEDMHLARRLLREAGSDAALVAKIERAEAVADDAILDELILASDAVMVARGDLGVEIGDAELTGIQKHIIARARRLNRAVITATQMLESMISSPLPTRAEVSDIANAVFDHTDAVMLSAESAAGDYPCEAVQAMARVCLGAEKQPLTQRSGHRLEQVFSHCDETIAMAAMYAANHLQGVSAIVCLTESGNTPLIMSRIRTPLPIFAVSPSPRTLARTALYRGVYPLLFDQASLPSEQVNPAIVAQLKSQGAVQTGDWVLLTKGDLHSPGGTNNLKILKVE
ncbi:pyruvate kinase [Atopomonas sediminilitoris]|uniref:pyruvate kinase n=1 Tax=Atopomonas sediminilitoris TaxID=2919919 RepID=UPI001F4DB624|nr:pyruvate kinase [Atopomonas sediminilitoris]MCJ8169075.1 pyruvate kinase [Atopomonas sediminilitoris]